MTRMKKYTVVLVVIAAIGLLWAYAAWRSNRLAATGLAMRLRRRPVRTLLPTMLGWTIRPLVLPTAVPPTDRSRLIGRAAVMLAPVAGRGWVANLFSPSRQATVPTVAACPVE